MMPLVGAYYSAYHGGLLTCMKDVEKTKSHVKSTLIHVL